MVLPARRQVCLRDGSQRMLRTAKLLSAHAKDSKFLSAHAKDSKLLSDL